MTTVDEFWSPSMHQSIQPGRGRHLAFLSHVCSFFPGNQEEHPGLGRLQVFKESRIPNHLPISMPHNSYIFLFDERRKNSAVVSAPKPAPKSARPRNPLDRASFSKHQETRKGASRVLDRIGREKDGTKGIILHIILHIIISHQKPTPSFPNAHTTRHSVLHSTPHSKSGR
jgi:hypothetical protein